MSRNEDLTRILKALELAAVAARKYTPGAVEAQEKVGGDPVTAADLAIDEVLRAELPLAGEGWLSEETVDDAGRLSCERVWVVDPLDGTREFVEGIPEWCVSVGLVEQGRAVAGGICNPATGELFLGSIETGIVLNSSRASMSTARELKGTVVLASRSETKRGEWKRFEGASFSVRPMGSVAYKMARVSAGLEDMTWTLVPKHEWDVAAGTALVRAGGGTVVTLEGEEPVFNREVPKFTGLIATPPGLTEPVHALLAGEANLPGLG